MERRRTAKEGIWTKKLRLADIVPYERNAKKHDKRQIDNVAESIRQYGFVQPIVVDADGVIVIGHWRQSSWAWRPMNTFFCDVEKRFDFVGRINEDVNTYTRYGNAGWLGITVVDCVVSQKQTQKNDGGMSEVYRDNGNCHNRMHHKIDWNLCVPKILNEAHKKR